MSVPGMPFSGERLREPPRRERVTIQIARVPDDPNEIQVRISAPLDCHYASEVRAMALFSPSDGRLDLEYRAPLDLECMRAELSDTIAGLYKKGSASAKTLTSDPPERVPDDELRLLLAPIAKIGRSVYRRLFLNMKRFDSHHSDDTEFLKQVLQSILGRPNVIVIKSHLHLFPWGFLYGDLTFDSNDLITLDPLHFWGFKHQIEEEIRGVAKRVPILRPARIAAAICTSADAREEHRQGPFGALVQHHSVEVEFLHSTADLHRALSDFEADCLYFYGHASQDAPPRQTTSCLTLNGMPLTADDIAQNGPKFKKCPVFVFLNGCETTPLDRWNEESIAGLLCLHEEMKVCCITTFAKVPVAFGCAFGIAFWARFIDGATLGEALLHARTTMLEKYANPLGLLYTLFGKVDTHIK